MIYHADRAAAERILRDFIDDGNNSLKFGPVYAAGYHNHYPNTDWRTSPAKLAEVIAWARDAGVKHVQLFVFPDIPPYFWGPDSGWDTVLCKHDLEYPYKFLRDTGLIDDCVVAWEQYTFVEDFIPVLELLREWFPNHQRGWHNPLGHLSPGHGSEETNSWRALSPWLHFHEYQGYPRNIPPPSERSSYDQTIYDGHDMKRRYDGVNSPWGGPILGASGKPIELRYSEGIGYWVYWDESLSGDDIEREAYLYGNGTKPFSAYCLDGKRH